MSLRYRLFVHPNRRGEGPTLWGYWDCGSSTEIVFGKLEGPHQQRTMKQGYAPPKERTKSRDGYQLVGEFPADQLSVLLGLIKQLRPDSTWQRIPLNTVDPDIQRTLREARSVLGMGTDHSSDGVPPLPQTSPAPRRANPEPSMVVRLPPKKSVQWMF